MRGAGKKPVAYVPTQDRELKVAEQTIVWVKPKNTKMGAYSSRRYTSAFAESAESGQYDPEEWFEAMVGDFCECVVRMDNVAFSDEYLESHPEIRKDSNELGFYTKPIITQEMIRDVAEDAPDGFVNEIINIASNRVRLNQGAKKNLNWSQSLLSGDPLLLPDGELTIAPSA